MARIIWLQTSSCLPLQGGFLPMSWSCFSGATIPPACGANLLCWSSPTNKGRSGTWNDHTSGAAVHGGLRPRWCVWFPLACRQLCQTWSEIFEVATVLFGALCQWIGTRKEIFGIGMFQGFRVYHILPPLHVRPWKFDLKSILLVWQDQN